MIFEIFDMIAIDSSSYKKQILTNSTFSWCTCLGNGGGEILTCFENDRLNYSIFRFFICSTLLFCINFGWEWNFKLHIWSDSRVQQRAANTNTSTYALKPCDIAWPTKYFLLWCRASITCNSLQSVVLSIVLQVRSNRKSLQSSILIDHLSLALITLEGVA